MPGLLATQEEQDRWIALTSSRRRSHGPVTPQRQDRFIHISELLNKKKGQQGDGL